VRVLVPGAGEVPLATVSRVSPLQRLAPGIYGFTLQVPETPALIGEHFFAHGLFVDPTTPAEPLRLTIQMAELIIGPK
jgi:hypothetical protein